MVCLLAEKYPDYFIVNLDCLDYCATQKNVQAVVGRDNYKFVQGSILSFDFLVYLLQTEKIDTIMHFAAQSHVGTGAVGSFSDLQGYYIDHSFGNSLHFTQTNVLGTHTLLEAARVHGIKRFIHVSTDEVYGEAAYDGVRQSASFGGPC